jgi:hypothetical protein
MIKYRQNGNGIIMFEKYEWTLCQKPKTGDILRWNEPLWAAPNKPRGKPDKIGEQQITAKLMVIKEFLSLKVLSVKKLSTDEAILKVKEGDEIRRKKATLKQGMCHKGAIA